MRKYLKVLLVGMLFAGQSAYGEEYKGMTLTDLLEQAEHDEAFQERSAERIKLLDINSDKKISYNEISNAATGVSEIPESVADDSQKAEMKGYLLEVFEECDKNKDNELATEEVDEFIKKLRYFLIKQQFENRDKNHDGVYDMEDMPSAEESMKQMQEAIAKMQEVTEKLEKVDTDELAKNWMNNISTAMADEDFYQMDKDEDGCITREEYVNYQMQTDEDSEDNETKLSKLDYVRWYINIKKEKPDCVTKEEYIADANMPIEEQLEVDDNPEDEKLYAELLFDEIDSDNNGKITAEEYAEYNYERDKKLMDGKEPTITKEDHKEVFLRVEAPDKGWLNKEEFVTAYMKNEQEDNIEGGTDQEEPAAE